MIFLWKIYFISLNPFFFLPLAFICLRTVFQRVQLSCLCRYSLHLYSSSCGAKKRRRYIYISLDQNRHQIDLFNIYWGKLNCDLYIYFSHQRKRKTTMKRKRKVCMKNILKLTKMDNCMQRNKICKWLCLINWSWTCIIMEIFLIIYNLLIPKNCIMKFYPSYRTS